jgi:hypothetical protein
MAVPGNADAPLKLPAGLLARVADAAAAEETTPEVWIERALTRQLDETSWQQLVEAGRRRSQALGYTEADVERLIAESRAESGGRAP